MNEDTVRIGYISSVDPNTGMVRVTYPDRDRTVTPEFPVFNMGGEYRMPKVNDLVLVLHLSNDSSAGIVMGTYWTDEDAPVSGEDQYRKDFSEDRRKFLRCAGKLMELVSPELTFRCDAGSISVAELLAMKEKVDRL